MKKITIIVVYKNPDSTGDHYELKKDSSGTRQ